MRFSGLFIAALVVGLSVSSGTSATASDEKPADPTYKAVIHHDGHAKEVKFDLRKKEDRATLVEALENGKVEELELVKPMPNPLAFTWDLGVWAIVVFVGLVFILRKLAWAPMLEGLQKREEHIRGAVEEAKTLRVEIAKNNAEFKANMDAAYAEIPKLMDGARKDAAALKDEIRNEGNAEVQKERQRLRREIEVATDQALQTIWTQTAQLATLISAKAVGQGLKAEDHRRLVDEALAEMRQKTN